MMPADFFPGVDLSTTYLPREVDAIRRSISDAMRLPDPSRGGSPIGKAITGIYAFFDYDGEPIYVGQTSENFGTRIGRHMTGMRSDSVGKYVLDPFEVYAIALWSLPHIEHDFPKKDRKRELDKYEYTVHHRLTGESKFGAVLNEGTLLVTELMADLPEPIRAVIIPNDIFPDRAHPDVRIARRAITVSLLAKNISERKVSKGLRQALLVQTKRLEDLAGRRADALANTAEDAADGSFDFSEGNN
ncbi:GIY-YIG nuclease family protein [Cryobacterium sp. HLT2-28]|uniref:GIY-YIG nuclease family protein n=1 Tax=Cryobacterium sp. HLT2-28 TaxID=1259146 RepID=UPI001A7E7830|nr:GIY-YIG nuclease family protein [Cryobacterium sp. HLT2-28]